MPFAKIHVLEGRYDERRLANVSTAVQEALISVLNIPSDDFFQIVHELPRNDFLHTPSLLGMKYSDDFMIQLVEGPGENFSFGQGLAQRAFISQAT